MIANYHTHTWRCNHATGREEAYVRAALDRNFEVLGFSDHSPYFFSDGYVSRIRMKPEQLKDYCDTVRLLQKKYADRIAISLGLELEFYPKFFDRLLPVLREAGIEYLLLGQHFLDNEMGAHYNGHATADVDILKAYCRQSMDAMQTGVFTYFAHPDLINFKGDEKVYCRYVRELCREAKSCGLPLEVNVLGKWSGRHYPNPVFWREAADENCPVILGCDAHAPDQLKRMDAEEQLLAMIREYGLPLLEKINLRKIG